MASNENTLRQIFGNNFSKSAFKKIDGEYRIIGKYGEIALNDDGSFDCWLVSPDRTPFSSQFVTWRTKDSRANWRVLTGEAHMTTTDTELVLTVALLLGIKRKRTYSNEQLEAMKERMANMRESK